MADKFRQYYSTLLLLILAFAFFSRVFMLHEPNTYIFDEVYHAVTAKLIAQNDPRAYEWWNPAPEPETAVDWLHPPLAKYSQAFFIYFLGEHTFAWRFSSVVFGVGVVWLTALMAKELFGSKRLSLLAALLVSLDGLLLVQSRITMNDIHVTFFILLTFLLYFKHLRQNIGNKTYQYSQYLFYAGVSAGLAISSKWSGAFALALVGIIEGFTWLSYLWKNRTVIKQQLPQHSLALLRIIGALVLIPIIIYFLSYIQMFLQGKDLEHFAELHNQIWHYQTNLEATHPAQSRPWQWFLNLKPVWIAVDYVSDTHRGNIYSFGNPVLFLLGALSVIWTFVYLLLKFFKRKIATKHLPLLFLFICYLVVWLPWVFSPRIMFFYHYAPAVPLMVILLSYWLQYLWKKYPRPYIKKSIIGLIVAVIIAFIIWYPHWTNIPVPIPFMENVYFLIESWQ